MKNKRHVNFYFLLCLLSMLLINPACAHNSSKAIKAINVTEHVGRTMGRSTSNEAIKPTRKVNAVNSSPSIKRIQGGLTDVTRAHNENKEVYPEVDTKQKGIKVREVTGHGITQELALSNGLIEAIRQVKGVSISSVREVRSGLTEVNSTYNGKDSDYSRFVTGQRSRILSKVKGYIKSYEIINDFERSSYGWKVSLRVEIPVYKGVGKPNNRRGIAVIPFKSSKRYFNFFKPYNQGNEISSKITQRLVVELTQSRRFNVMDRENMDTYLREKNLLLSYNAPTTELSKLGEILGVDYLLVGKIIDASFIKEPYSIQITGESGVNYSASFTVDYRIIVMATMEIKWADTISLSFNNSELEDIDSSHNQINLEKSIINIAAKNIINSALNNIYPIRVVKSVPDSNTIVLNRGGVSLSIGDSLDVFSLGEKLIDPDSGESLGSMEMWVATAEITRSIPKMSFAKIVKGNILDVANNSICRRVKKKKYQKEIVYKKDNVRFNDGDGVKLPFD